MPQEVINQVMDTYNREVEAGASENKITIKTLGMIRNIIEKWFFNAFFPFWNGLI